MEERSTTNANWWLQLNTKLNRLCLVLCLDLSFPFFFSQFAHPFPPCCYTSRLSHPATSPPPPPATFSLPASHSDNREFTISLSYTHTPVFFRYMAFTRNLRVFLTCARMCFLVISHATSIIHPKPRTCTLHSKPPSSLFSLSLSFLPLATSFPLYTYMHVCKLFFFLFCLFTLRKST